MSPANWWVNTNNKVYGPYSAAQMSRFIGEGRVIATTLVADKPEGAEWTEARYVPDLRGALHEERTTFHTQRVDRRKQIASANMLVWADIVTGASMRFLLPDGFTARDLFRELATTEAVVERFTEEAPDLDEIFIRVVAGDTRAGAVAAPGSGTGPWPSAGPSV